MNDRRLLILLALVLAAGLILRATMLRFPYFSEPDNFVYAYVANQTLHNAFQLTATLSGVPPNPYPEGLPLVYLPAILAFLSNQSVYSVMEWLAPLFSLLGILLAYLLTYELSKNRYAALLAAFIYAVLPAALGRGMAGMWRGEVATPILLGYSFLLAINWYSNRKAAYGISAIALFILTVFWWNGGVYALGCAALLALSYLLYAVLRKRIGSPLKLNRIVHLGVIGLVLLASPLLYVQYWNVVSSGHMQSIAASITEQAPPSFSIIVYYYGGWVLFLALAGVVIAGYYGSSEKFDMPQYAMFSMFLPTFILSLIAIRWTALFALPVAVYGAYGLYALIRLAKPSRLILLMSVTFLIVVLAGLGALFSWNTAPASNISPQVVAADEWLASNTPANSLVLTLWPDGSMVESIGHRESYSDSIMGGTHMPGFGQFLYAYAGNYMYLNATLDRVHPNYLMVRRYWLNESIAILVEANLNVNKTINGTNLQAFLNGSVRFPLVYRNNDTSIYRLN